MTSGIYRLTFRSGSYYIGKSINIENRFNQHLENLSKNKAAKSVQAEYDTYGTPRAEILYECHPDHIDLMETVALFIMRSSEHTCLNSATTKRLSDAEVQFLLENKDKLSVSTIGHLREVSMLTKKVSNQELVIRALSLEVRQLEQEGITTPSKIVDLKTDHKKALITIASLEAEIKNLRNQTWWDKLWS